jgi:hypothetical protein
MDEIPIRANMSYTKNADLLDEETGKFSILGVLTMNLRGPFWWRSEDIQSDQFTGVLFEVRDDQGHELGSITIVDASNDSEEIDVSGINEDVSECDKYLHDTLAKYIQIESWAHSKLSMFDGRKILETNYVESRDDKHWRHIALRMPVNGKKFVVLGIFDVDHEDMAAPIIFKSMQTVSVLS